MRSRRIAAIAAVYGAVPVVAGFGRVGLPTRWCRSEPNRRTLSQRHSRLNFQPDDSALEFQDDGDAAESKSDRVERMATFLSIQLGRRAVLQLKHRAEQSQAAAFSVIEAEPVKSSMDTSHPVVEFTTATLQVQDAVVETAGPADNGVSGTARESTAVKGQGRTNNPIFLGPATDAPEKVQNSSTESASTTTTEDESATKLPIGMGPGAWSNVGADGADDIASKVNDWSVREQLKPNDEVTKDPVVLKPASSPASTADAPSLSRDVDESWSTTGKDALAPANAPAKDDRKKALPDVPDKDFAELQRTIGEVRLAGTLMSTIWHVAGETLEQRLLTPSHNTKVRTSEIPGDTKEWNWKEVLSSASPVSNAPSDVNSKDSSDVKDVKTYLDYGSPTEPKQGKLIDNPLKSQLDRNIQSSDEKKSLLAWEQTDSFALASDEVTHGDNVVVGSDDAEFSSTAGEETRIPTGQYLVPTNGKGASSVEDRPEVPAAEMERASTMHTKPGDRQVALKDELGDDDYLAPTANSAPFSDAVPVAKATNGKEFGRPLPVVQEGLKPLRDESDPLKKSTTETFDK